MVCKSLGEGGRLAALPDCDLFPSSAAHQLSLSLDIGRPLFCTRLPHRALPLAHPARVRCLPNAQFFSSLRRAKAPPNWASYNPPIYPSLFRPASPLFSPERPAADGSPGGHSPP